MNPTKKIIFETKRLLIRDFTLADLEAVHDYAKNEDVIKYQNWGPNTKEETLRFLREVINLSAKKPRLVYEVGIELKETEHLIGGCSIFIQHPEDTEATIGYTLHPDYWGNGYATEVAAGLITHVQSTLGLPTLTATCDTRNLASQRVLEKNGFQLERILKNNFEQQGMLRDTCVYRLG